MSFDLPPAIYNALQRLVHGQYDGIGALLGSMKQNHPGRVLEVGCGTGNLSRFFGPDEYVGIDLDAHRVELARKLHPSHRFLMADATKMDPEWLGDFAFAFCHACIHHIDDSGVATIIAKFDQASELSNSQRCLLVMEPLLPDKPFTNLPGFCLAKMDRGRYMRKFSELKALMGERIRRYEISQGPWFWPVPGVNCLVEFCTATQRPESKLISRVANA